MESLKEKPDFEKVTNAPIPSIYTFIAQLVTTYQMDIEDWELGPMTRKNYRTIHKRIEEHNENLKLLAISLKSATELSTRQLKQQILSAKEEIERLKQELKNK